MSESETETTGRFILVTNETMVEMQNLVKDTFPIPTEQSLFNDSLEENMLSPDYQKAKLPLSPASLEPTDKKSPKAPQVLKYQALNDSLCEDELLESDTPCHKDETAKDISPAAGLPPSINKDNCNSFKAANSPVPSLQNNKVEDSISSLPKCKPVFGKKKKPVFVAPKSKVVPSPSIMTDELPSGIAASSSDCEGETTEMQQCSDVSGMPASKEASDFASGESGAVKKYKAPTCKSKEDKEMKKMVMEKKKIEREQKKAEKEQKKIERERKKLEKEQQKIEKEQKRAEKEQLKEQKKILMEQKKTEKEQLNEQKKIEQEKKKIEKEQKKIEREQKKEQLNEQKKIEQEKKIEKEQKKTEKEQLNEQKRLEQEKKKIEKEQKKIEREQKKTEKEQLEQKKVEKEKKKAEKEQMIEQKKKQKEKEKQKENEEKAEKEKVNIKSEMEEDIEEATEENKRKGRVDTNPSVNCTDSTNTRHDVVPETDIHKKTPSTKVQGLPTKPTFKIPIKKTVKPTKKQADQYQSEPPHKKRKITDNKATGNNGCSKQVSIKPQNHSRKRKRKAAFAESDSDSEEETKRSKPANYSGPVWVQCENIGCQKWRKLADYTDPSQVPEDWMCSMNTDTEHNKCSAPEEKWSDLEESQEFVETIFIPGSIVWAKMDGYPWWPAMIEEDPDEESYYEMGIRSQNIPVRYHVVFFDTPVSRGWIHSHNIQLFTDVADANEEVNFTVNKKYERALKQGSKMARAAMKLDKEERLDQFGFINRRAAYKRMKYYSKKESSTSTGTTQVQTTL